MQWAKLRIDLLRTTNFRQASTIAVVFVLVSIGAVMLSQSLITHLIRGHVSEMIFADINVHMQSTNLTTVDTVQKLLQHRERFEQRPERRSFLVEANGTVRLGDPHLLTALLSTAPACAPLPCPIATVSYHAGDTDILGMRVSLADGGQYISAYDIRPMLTRVMMIPLAVGLGLLGLLLVSLLIGLRFSSATLRRVATINETLARYSSGSPEARVDLSGECDEFAHLGREINRALDRINQLVDEVRSVSGHVAHELRTPLTRLQTHLLTVADHTEGEVRAEILSAVGDVSRIYRLSRAILRISEIETGRCRHQLTPIDAASLLSDVVEYYSPLAESLGTPLILQTEPFCTLFGDRDLMIQAVSNLLDNALKYAPPGREIRLQAQNTEHGVALIVADHGPGIEPHHRSLALQRFQRLNHAAPYPGDGLGLPLVKAVMDLHRGTVTLEENHPGLRVILSVPR